MEQSNRFDFLELDADQAPVCVPTPESMGPSLRTATTLRSLVVVQVIGRKGTGVGEFNAPAGLAVDSDGNLYVCDAYNHRIQKFMTNGTVVAIGRKGGILHTQTVPVTVPAKPEWLGSQEGISTKVLDPWTPVELEGGHVRVWGRDYAFGPLPFPTQAVSAGENILAGPVSVLVVADGKEEQLKIYGSEYMEVGNDGMPVGTILSDGKKQMSIVTTDGQLRLTDIQLAG